MPTMLPRIINKNFKRWGKIIINSKNILVNKEQTFNLKSQCFNKILLPELKIWESTEINQLKISLNKIKI